MSSSWCPPPLRASASSLSLRATPPLPPAPLPLVPAGDDAADNEGGATAARFAAAAVPKQIERRMSRIA